MSKHKLPTIFLAIAMVVLNSRFTQGGDHAAWPTDWNNWSDPELWVTVGNSGNSADTTGYGCVNHNYQISKYEITAGQYTAFLNAVAKTDTYELYDSNMWSNYQGCKILQSGASGSYTYSVASDYANRPVNFVSWGDAVRYANWMDNNQPTGLQRLSTTEDGSYYLNGATSDVSLAAVIRKSDAKYVIPSADEWYKAAYYDPNKLGGGGYWNYPTRTNTAPSRDVSELTNSGNNANYWISNPGHLIDSGKYYTSIAGEFQLSASPYGTFDQGGNVWEWNESIIDPEASLSHGYGGGSFRDDLYNLLTRSQQHYFSTWEEAIVGFRIAYVPEPSTFVLLGMGAISLIAYAWRQRKRP